MLEYALKTDDSAVISRVTADAEPDFRNSARDKFPLWLDDIYGHYVCLMFMISLTTIMSVIHLAIFVMPMIVG
jgi:hypothetical protein